ncbi:MAG: ABC transporter substrate-binding protein [Caldilineales bacterium]|nr:ABC transporter substrate-binding protein [Caldilineales bacterium]
MVQRRIAWAGLLLLLLLALAACAPPGQQAVSGELNLLCTPQVEWCEGMKAEFEAKYPTITVNFVRMSSGESLTRLRNEKDNPQFDIWWGGPIDSFVAAKQEGLLEKYETKSQDKIINKDLMLDADKYWVGIYVGSLGFATNTTSGITPPTSWDDLLQPDLKGQVMVAHPSSSGTSYTALCTVLQLRGEEAGWDYLRQYAGQVNQFTKSGAAPARFTGQGEAAVGIVFSHDIVAQIEAGLPLALTFPAEGTGYEIGGMGIIKGAKNLAAAKLWYDWALQPETQELGPKYKAYQAPTVEGAKASRPELLEANLIDYDFEWCGSHKKEFIDRFTNEIAGAANLKE